MADAWRTRAATGRPLVYLQRSAVSRVKNPCTRSTTQKLNSAALAVERRCPCRLCHRGTPTLPSSSPRPSWLRNAGHWRISVPNGRHLVSYGTLLHQCGAVVPDGSNISAHPALDQCAIRGWPQQQLQLVPIRQIRFDPVLPGVPFQHHGPLQLWMGMSGPASVVMTLAVRSSVPSSPFHYSRSPAKTTGSPSVDAERAFTIGVLRDSQDSGDRADVPAGPPIRQQSRFQSGIQQPGELTGFVVEGDATAQTPSLCTGACETVRSTTLSQRTRR